MKTIGIDVGSYSAHVAECRPDGVPALIPDSADKGSFETRTALLIHDGFAFVGQAALAAYYANPQLNLLEDVRALLGTEDPAGVNADGTKLDDESVMALFLSKLVRDIESLGEGPPGRVVATVPVDTPDRIVTRYRNAAAVAGLANLQFVEEPVAAMFHVEGEFNSRSSTALLCDLGGDVFSASIFRREKEWELVCAVSELGLGGIQLDRSLAQFAIEQSGIRIPDDQITAVFIGRRLRAMAESWRLNPLKQPKRCCVVVSGNLVDVLVSHVAMRRWLAPEMARLAQCLTALSTQTEINLIDVDEVVLLGGATADPLVTVEIEKLIGRSVGQCHKRHAATAIAFGTARLANREADHRYIRSVSEVTGSRFDLGIRTIQPDSQQPTVDILVSRGSGFPAAGSREYAVSCTRPLALDVVQLKDDQKCIAIGRIEVDAQGMLPGEAITVSLGYDQDGRILIQSTNPKTGSRDLHMFELPDERFERRKDAIQELTVVS